LKAKLIKKRAGKKITAKEMKTKKTSSAKPKERKAVVKTKSAPKSGKTSKTKVNVKTQKTGKTKVTKKEVKKAVVRKGIEGNPVIQPVTVKIPEKKYSPNKKTRYTQKELRYFKGVIIQERNEILESARANMRSLVDSESGEYVGDNLTYSSHMAEQGTDEMEREKNYLFVQRDEKYLGYLQESLSRIDQGTYGVCVDCLEIPKNLCKTCPLIPKERLELVPITQHCIDCKNRRG